MFWKIVSFKKLFVFLCKSFASDATFRNFNQVSFLRFPFLCCTMLKCQVFNKEMFRSWFKFIIASENSIKGDSHFLNNITTIFKVY